MDLLADACQAVGVPDAPRHLDALWRDAHLLIVLYVSRCDIFSLLLQEFRLEIKVTW